ncbi:RCC1-like G exchanging factor-like protein [Eurytemora carolleeae]|uniref:RCC1-like G exchanging factor-like protein n=1 Tax=Eurytemora carolleeae TaxID=1294199 RepID=UPI000C77246A|nr:RCC1-like G exchanging factor-like protein [Eurytemora carolleeae]|eukprot:XP_023337429.1 RCC1-like G exchanging factor-like protein [Eurytemora affinis]
MLSVSKNVLEKNINLPLRECKAMLSNSFNNHSKAPPVRSKQRGVKILPEDSVPTFQFASDKPEKSKRVYMFGNASSGQLGQPKFLNPERNLPIVERMHKPYRIPFAEYEDVRTLSCGYGFTVFSTHGSKDRVFGCGFNSDGQIGYHERIKGRPLELVIAPTKIDISLPSDQHIQVTGGSLTAQSYFFILVLGNFFTQ